MYNQANMNNKKNIAILFGGKSAEHEVSLQSAKSIFQEIDKDLYNPFLIGIDKEGKWFVSEDLESVLLDGRLMKDIKKDYVALTPQCEGKVIFLTGKETKIKIDVVFPILHGPFGEDGTVQGVLKLADIPFVGSSVLGSAVGMDKEAMKKILKDNSIPVADYLCFYKDEEILGYEEVVKRLKSPFFVKPANMGSSVGVSKVYKEKDYHKAISLAFDYDLKIIVEEFVEGREIECSVLGNSNPRASVLGEVIPSHDFYSYESKYIDEEGASLKVPADVNSEIAEKIQNLAVKTFKALYCEGLGRVDFFLKENGELFVNEINTMPGFTKISMYPKLWEASGVSYKDLITELINLSLKRFKIEKELKTGYRA